MRGDELASQLLAGVRLRSTPPRIPVLPGSKRIERYAARRHDRAAASPGYGREPWGNRLKRALEKCEEVERHENPSALAVGSISVFSGRMYGYRTKSVHACMTSQTKVCLQEAEQTDGAS